MKLDEFINEGWNDHGANAAAVGARLDQGLALIETNEQIAPLANLAAHVYGEHLGEWNKGVAYLKQLRANPKFAADSESDKAIARLTVALELAAGREANVAAFSTSDQIRILAVAAAALAGQMHTNAAQKFFREALGKAEGLAKEDPANRALAVTGNNLAAALEEKPERTGEEKDLMILAAQTGRKFWEIAGTWNQVMWAEYRLANSYLKAQDFAKALVHGQTAIKIAAANNVSEEDKAYLQQVLTLVRSR